MSTYSLALVVIATMVSAAFVAAALRALFRGMREKAGNRLAEEAALCRGPLVRKPEKASFRGATERWGRIKNDGGMFLAPDRLVFVPLAGDNIIGIDLAEMKDVTLERTFMAEWRPGRLVLVIWLADSTVLGFYVGDPKGWRDDLESAIAKAKEDYKAMERNAKERKLE